MRWISTARVSTAKDVCLDVGGAAKRIIGSFHSARHQHQHEGVTAEAHDLLHKPTEPLLGGARSSLVAILILSGRGTAFALLRRSSLPLLALLLRFGAFVVLSISTTQQ